MRKAITFTVKCYFGFKQANGIAARSNENSHQMAKWYGHVLVQLAFMQDKFFADPNILWSTHAG